MLLLVSRPVSIRVPPNGQLAPLGSALVTTSELVPAPLQTYDVPVGFTSDHLEILYDIDVSARRVAEEAGLALVRTASLNDDPALCAALARRLLASAGELDDGG